MPKKIIDIAPPEETPFDASAAESFKSKKPFGLAGKIIAGVIFISIIVILVVFTLNSTVVLLLKPVTRPISANGEIEINVSQSDLDFQQGIIPGHFFSAENTKREDFIPTGKALIGAKAKGTITVYNKQNPPRAIVLKTGTHFLSSWKQKMFVTKQRLYLPAASVSKGKIIPSATNVSVEAQETGEDYNIKPSKFSVPKLAGNTLYYSIWAESKKDMAGGFAEEVKEVTEQDLKDARAKLKNSLLLSTEKSLKSNLHSDFILPQKAIIEENSQITCSQKPGDKVPKLSCEGNLKIKGLAIKFSQLKELALSLLSKKITSENKIIPNSLQFNFIPRSRASESGKMIGVLTVGGKSYKDINENLIRIGAQRKSKKDISKDIHRIYPDIQILAVKIFPFWMAKSPAKLENIKLKLTF